MRKLALGVPLHRAGCMPVSQLPAPGQADTHWPFIFLIAGDVVLYNWVEHLRERWQELAPSSQQDAQHEQAAAAADDAAELLAQVGSRWGGQGRAC